jgi:hypothetical protein
VNEVKRCLRGGDVGFVGRNHESVFFPFAVSFRSLASNSLPHSTVREEAVQPRRLALFPGVDTLHAQRQKNAPSEAGKARENCLTATTARTTR